MRKPVGVVTYTEQLQRIVADYRRAGEPWPATMRQVAAWALGNDRWRPQRDSLISQCAEQLARALREEYLVDPQGRTVRAKHAARIDIDGEQLVLWADIRSADRKHMQIAFQQRRQQIVGDCHQLKLDADSYNENGNSGRPIQMVFDFTEDLAELETLEASTRVRQGRSSVEPPVVGAVRDARRPDHTHHHEPRPFRR